MVRLEFFATAAKGTAEVLAGELRELGAEDVEPRAAGASFHGSLEVAYRACLCSRVASRVLLPIGSFAAPTPQALYDGVRTIRWREHVDPRRTLAVDFASSRSAIEHTRFGALKTKDAIVDQLREETGRRPSIDPVRPAVRVNVHLHEDRALLSIDLSGQSLHRRFYRGRRARAPLKENLAAALLLLAGWPELARAGAPFLDPMCGSGTLPLEAALIAAHIAPAHRREYFGFLGWRGHDGQAWERVRAQAREREIRDPRRLPPIHGYDADAGAIRGAIAAAEQAGLRRFVHLERRRLAESAPPPRARRPGLMVTNPPYGERLGEGDALGGLYAEIGDVVRQRFLGWTAVVLTGNAELARRIGLRPARRHVLYNGALECRLLVFPISSEPAKAAPRWRRA